MVDLSLDMNPSSSTYRDLLVVKGDLILTSDANPSGTNPVQQNILQRMSFFLAEWFLDNTKGLPWFQRIFVKGAKQSDIDALLSNVIMGTPGVQTLQSYSFKPNSAKRNCQVTFVAQTVSGKIDYSGTVTAQGGA